MSAQNNPEDSYIEIEGEDDYNLREAKVNDFAELGVSEELLRGILGYGWDTPSAIQQLAIPAVMTKRDVVGQAQSGTGKTGTFSIGTLSKVNPGEKTLQAVIMTPVRALATQTYKVIKALSDYMNINVALMIGGTLVGDNINAVNAGCQVVVATPGRFADVFGKKMNAATHLANVKIFVVDEADEMLSYGFMDQLRGCFQMLPEDVQVCLFSATMPEEILEITKRFMRNPIRILMKREEIQLRGIEQHYVACENDTMKVDAIKDLQETFPLGQSIIFANSRERVEQLHYELQQRNFACVAIHGQMDFQEQKQILEKFISGEYLILLATDMLARGLDVQTVKVTVNFDIPRSIDNYIHRIGRSGRFGRKGLGINLITSSDIPQMKRIEEYYQTEITELPANLRV